MSLQNIFRECYPERNIEIISQILQYRQFEISHINYQMKLSVARTQYHWQVDVFLEGNVLNVYISKYALLDIFEKIIPAFRSAHINIQKCCIYHVIDKMIISALGINAKIIDIMLIEKNAPTPHLISVNVYNSKTSGNIAFNCDRSFLPKLTSFLGQYFSGSNARTICNPAIKMMHVKYELSDIPRSTVCKNALAFMENTDNDILIFYHQTNIAYVQQMDGSYQRVNIADRNIYYVHQILLMPISNFFTENVSLASLDHYDCNIFIYQKRIYGRYTINEYNGMNFASIVDIFKLY